MDLLNTLSRHFKVRNNYDNEKLNRLYECVILNDYDTENLFAVVKHYKATPDHDCLFITTTSLATELAKERVRHLLNDETDEFHYKLYEVCALPGWAGSNYGHIIVKNGQVSFKPDSSLEALHKFAITPSARRRLTLVRKLDGKIMVLFEKTVWIESDNAECALSAIGKQIDDYYQRKVQAID